MAKFDTEINEKAAYWLAALHEGEPSEALLAEFDAWIAASPAHAEAYFALSDTFYAMDMLDPDAFAPSTSNQVAPNQSTSKQDGSNVISFDKKKSQAPKSTSSKAKPWGFGRSWLAAASVAVVVFVSQSFFVSENADYVAAVGEISTHQLDDASVVNLNTDSLLNVSMTEAVRKLELVRGEAYFTVAKDASRPFIVHSDAAQVRALGTEFVVYNRGEGRTRVSVHESSVEVSHPEYFDEPVVVSAGQSVEFGPNSENRGVEELADVDLPTWREGRLVLNRMPLKDVIAVLNQYHEGKIVLDDAVGDRQISGVFHDINSVRILNDIIETQQLASLRLTNRIIYVY